MKSALACCTALAALMLASTASAQVAGSWHVTGTVGGTSFAVDCQFDPEGAAFGGACADGATGAPKAYAGKTHKLSKGAVAGRQVQWTYPASFLLAKFDVNFAGTLHGDQIAGTVSAAGRKGDFKAVKK